MEGTNDRQRGRVIATRTMSAGRLAFLDCLRAIAVMLVFVTHSTEKFSMLPGGGGSWLAWLAYEFNFGRVGVVVFFAISGFLIPSSLRGGVGDGSVRFVVSRFFRLFPAFWVSIPAAVGAQLWLQGRAIGDHDLLLNFTMLPRLFGAPMANGAYWTLEVELLFYILCAFLFIGGLLGRGFVLSAFALALGFLFYTSQRPVFSGLLNPDLSGEAFYFWLHISVMFWGAVCRKLWDGERIGAPALLMFGLYSGYLLLYRPLLLGYQALWLHHVGTEAIRWSAGYSGAMWIFVLLVFFRPLHSRLLAWMGRISYSFYLLHGPAIYLVFWLAERHAGLQGGPMAAYMLVSFALALVVSEASFTLVEAPCVALGRQVSKWLLRRLGWAAAEPRAVPARLA